MGGVIYTTTDGYISNIPVEYMYANDGNLWYVEHSETTMSSGTFTLFLETRTCKAQGFIFAHCTSDVSVSLYELPAGAGVPDIAGSYSHVSAHNLRRVSPGDTVAPLTRIKLDNGSNWDYQAACTLLQTIRGSNESPASSADARTFWYLKSSATYALVVASGGDNNTITLSYTWNETVA